MPTISRAPRKLPLKGAIAFAMLIGAWLTAPACGSSSSSSEFSKDAAVDVIGLPNCDNVVAIESNVLPSGSCDSSKARTCVVNASDVCTGTSTIWTCACNVSWSCNITGGSLSGCNTEDAGDDGSDAANDDETDASDASDD